jgi:hypothetical protein
MAPITDPEMLARLAKGREKARKEEKVEKITNYHVNAVYLVQVGTNILKLGITGVINWQRFYGYGGKSGCIVKQYIELPENLSRNDVEYKLKQVFNRQFNLAQGLEYFEGNIEEMMITFIDTVNNCIKEIPPPIRELEKNSQAGLQTLLDEDNKKELEADRNYKIKCGASEEDYEDEDEIIDRLSCLLYTKIPPSRQEIRNLEVLFNPGRKKLYNKEKYPGNYLVLTAGGLIIKYILLRKYTTSEKKGDIIIRLSPSWRKAFESVIQDDEGFIVNGSSILREHLREVEEAYLKYEYEQFLLSNPKPF